MESPNEIMTIEEVAKMLRCHRTSLYRLLKLNQIPHFRLGTDYRFRRSSIDAWMNKQEEGAGK
jgi:excisionase family DNA binding protein